MLLHLFWCLCQELPLSFLCYLFITQNDFSLISQIKNPLPPVLVILWCSSQHTVLYQQHLLHTGVDVGLLGLMHFDFRGPKEGNLIYTSFFLLLPCDSKAVAMIHRFLNIILQWLLHSHSLLHPHLKLFSSSSLPAISVVSSPYHGNLLVNILSLIPALHSCSHLFSDVLSTSSVNQTGVTADSPAVLLSHNHGYLSCSIQGSNCCLLTLIQLS